MSQYMVLKSVTTSLISVSILSICGKRRHPNSSNARTSTHSSSLPVKRTHNSQQLRTISATSVISVAKESALMRESSGVVTGCLLPRLVREIRGFKLVLQHVQVVDEHGVLDRESNGVPAFAKRHGFSIPGPCGFVARCPQDDLADVLTVDSHAAGILALPC